MDLGKCEAIIIGTVTGSETRTSAAGNKWGMFNVVIETQWGATTEITQLPVKVFGRAMDTIGDLPADGSEVQAVVRIASKEWKGKWYVDLILVSLEIIGGVNSADAADAEKALDNAGLGVPAGDDEPMPF